MSEQNQLTAKPIDAISELQSLLLGRLNSEMYGNNKVCDEHAQTLTIDRLGVMLRQRAKCFLKSNSDRTSSWIRDRVEGMTDNTIAFAVELLYRENDKGETIAQNKPELFAELVATLIRRIKRLNQSIEQ